MLTNLPGEFVSPEDFPWTNYRSWNNRF